MENRHSDETYGLGDLECEVHAVEGFETKKVRAGYCGAVVCGGLAACVPLVEGVLDPIFRPLLAGALLSGAAAFFAWALYWHRRIGKRVAVHQHGILVEHRDQIVVQRWEEIAAIHESVIHFVINGLASHTDRFVTLRDGAGRKLEFGGHSQRIAHVADTVAHRVYAHIRPKIIDRLTNGQEVDFGPLRISATGVETVEGRRSWDELRTVSVAQGQLRLYERERLRIWFSTALAAIPNQRILFDVFQATLGCVDASPAG